MNVSFNFTEMIFIYFKNLDIFRIDTNHYLLFIVACHRIMPKTLMPVAFSAVHKQQQQRVITDFHGNPKFFKRIYKI